MDSYNKIIYVSNALYNDGLEKAKQRDLSGAIQSLRKSLRFNKANTQARNLLGLIYYETGEVVDALSEWVLSRSLSPEGNPAEKYLEEIQSNRSQLNAVNQTIKKYNQALLYCQQDSKDLAIIQLKKVLSMNPGLVKGYQLLALLYMEEGKYELAKKELRMAAEIDTNNVTTLRYLREADRLLQDVQGKEGRKEKKEKAASYQSGNETIIQPTNFKDNSAVMTILNLVIGVGIGVLITWFLVIPGIRQNAVSDAKKAELAANDSLATRNQEVKSLESQIETLNKQIKEQKDASEDSKKIVDNYEQLLIAYDAFAQQNIQGAGDTIVNVDASLLDGQAKAIYDSLNTKVNEQYISAVYAQAEQDYRAGRYPEAVTGLEKVVQVEEDYNDGYAIYYLAQSYRQTGDLENAKKYFQRMVELHPGTSRARRSQQYLNELGQQPPQ
ncbi:MAG: tetratricopeptide repeat protein [Lachnospiraceae bacterium]|jgi:tetratricopeptide (TPR) repeat protein|nr:tetratricopeptide repeat protein [Lachnospiraceae bacterium]